MIIYFILATLLLPTYFCGCIALWFFGVRRYIHQHGGTCITAGNWGLSILADLTTAWEIGKKEGQQCLSVKLLLALQVVGGVTVFVYFLT